MKKIQRNPISLLVDIIYYVHKLLKFDIMWHNNNRVLAWVILQYTLKVWAHGREHRL